MSSHSLLIQQANELILTRSNRGRTSLGCMQEISLFYPRAMLTDLQWFSQRTGCDFTKDVPDYQMCETGGCNGGLECDPDTGTSTFDQDISEEAHPSPESSSREKLTLRFCSFLAGTGVLPVTLAEFNIQTDVDHYDTSNVDGFNIPMAVTNDADCPLSNCPYDLRKVCLLSLTDDRSRSLTEIDSYSLVPTNCSTRMKLETSSVV